MARNGLRGGEMALAHPDQRGDPSPVMPGGTRARRSLPVRDGAARTAAPLVATKLTPPLAPAGYRERPRISTALDRALDDRIRLTVVAAPPGYGKSVAVAGWLASRGVSYAWLSLDPGDDDLARAVRYLAAALSGPRPGTSVTCEALLGPGGGSSAELAAATLLEAIGATDDPFALVLDDYHAVRSGAVHAVVGYLVEHAPPFCHVVVISREDPPLPLARLRAHGRLVELRAEDLRYTPDEAAAYFVDAGRTLADDDLARLLERTEGWVAALQLASLGLARGEHPARLIGAFEGLQRDILDYLADEVLARVDDDLRSFLLQTSVAERFDAGLCAAITGRADAGGFLARAERSHLFVVPLDVERRWYRYHALFADYLRSRLPEPERRELQLRAAAWLEASGLRREAIPQLLAAGEWDEALHLVAAEARAAFDAGEHATLLRWIEALPADLVEANPDLVAWHAWALFEIGQLATADRTAARRLAATAERGLAEGRLLTLRALLQTVMGPDAASLAEEGLALVGDDPYFRAACLQAMGLAALARGDLAIAAGRLEEGFALSRHAGAVAAFGDITPLAQALLAVGRRDEAERLCHELLDEYRTPDGRTPPMGWYLDVVVGMLRYEANDVAEARRLLDQGFAEAGRYRVGRATVEWAAPHLALARRAAGDPEAAYDALRIAASDIRRSGLPLPVPIQETEARIRLLEGDLETAARWADAAPPDAGPQSPIEGILRLSSAVTRARVRLAQRRHEEARDLLREPEAGYRAWGAVADLVSVLVLQASCAEALGRRDDALGRLREAVELAVPGGYVRRCVEDGARLRHLLPLVRAQAPAFVDAVLAGLEEAAVPGHRGPSLWSHDGELIELLTPRELEVLHFLARGARNAEIAEALGVSEGTARWHVGNVLAKLGERSRAKAVLRARELGLL